MAGRHMKMTKDGLTVEVVRSAFRHVWSGKGWEKAEDDASTDPRILGLEEGESIEDYLNDRDARRAKAEAAQADAEARMAKVRAEAEAKAKAEATSAPANPPGGGVTATGSSTQSNG